MTRPGCAPPITCSPTPALLLSLSLVASAGCAGAQAVDGSVPTVAIDPPSPDAPGPGAPGMTATRVRTEPDGDPEADVAQIAVGIREVRQLLAEKQRERDVVWVLCLNDKLTRMKVMQRSAGEHREGLRHALGRGDEEEAIHQRTLLSVLRRLADGLVEESRQCV